jgi:preprotein translocase subunit SecG
MLTVLLVLQVIVTVSMIIVILIQRSSSDGMAGLAGGGNSIMSGRASTNLLTRITSVLAAAFIINSLVMAAMTARSSRSEKSIVDEIKPDMGKPFVPLAGAAPKEGSVAGGADVKADKDKPESGKLQKEETNPAVPIAK